MSTESAFPTIVTDRLTSKYSNEDFPDTYSIGGMSLLDWFAGKALEGIMSNAEFLNQIGIMSGEESKEAIVNFSFNLAEAMIKEKEKRERDGNS